MEWLEWERQTAFFEPRDYELSVPALARMRSEVWSNLPDAVQVMLCVADYLGIDRAATLNRTDFERLELQLPGPIIHRCWALPRSSDGSGFGLTLSGLIGAIAVAFDAVNKLGD